MSPTASLRHGSTTLRRLEEALGDLPFRRRDVEGVPTLFAGESGFAFLWEGRLGLIFREGTDAASLLNRAETTPWAPHPSLPPVPDTVLVPLAWLEEPDRLGPWIQKAHAQASTASRKRL